MKVNVFIGGVKYEGFADFDGGLDGPRVETTGPVSANVFIGFDPGSEIPYEDVTTAERARMEADARARVEERLREWGRLP